MGKALSDMTLEELWQLFPIFLTPHQDVWKNWYQEEADILQTMLPLTAQLHHIGSTAIPGIWAKPIIDILVEVEEGELERVRETLVRNGYRCMSQSPRRVSLNKGYTEDGFAQKVFHIHVRCQGDHDELYFRDYLADHPEVAKEYETLKLGLWKRFEHNRDGYTQAKTEFVQRYTQKAKGFPAPCLDIWQECDKM